MVILNDYLYSGDTVLRILHNYIKDLRKDAKKTGNEIDMIHCNFLLQIQELLEHNDFLHAAVSENERVLQIYGERISVYGIYFQRKDQITDPGRREIQWLCGGIHL